MYTQKEPDSPDASLDGELIAKLSNDFWLLFFDRQLFTPLSLFLRE